jgi:hypothetical protein
LLTPREDYRIGTILELNINHGFTAVNEIETFVKPKNANTKGYSIPTNLLKKNQATFDEYNGNLNSVKDFSIAARILTTLFKRFMPSLEYGFKFNTKDMKDTKFIYKGITYDVVYKDQLESSFENYECVKKDPTTSGHFIITQIFYCNEIALEYNNSNHKQFQTEMELKNGTETNGIQIEHNSTNKNFMKTIFKGKTPDKKVPFGIRIHEIVCGNEIKIKDEDIIIKDPELIVFARKPYSDLDLEILN